MASMFRKRPRSVPAKSREELDEIVRSLKAGKSRPDNYRERSLRMHGWICAKCGREFTSSDVHLLTVHHRDGNHDNNPPDGSNWENLCIYCHDDEHSRLQLAEFLSDKG